MRPARRRASGWTIVATVAGVVGAAGALFPLVFATEPQIVHLTLGATDSLYAETLADSVILTGNWRIKRIRRWWLDEVAFEPGRDPHEIIRGSFKDLRVPAPDAPGRRFVTLVNMW